MKHNTSITIIFCFLQTYHKIYLNQQSRKILFWGNKRIHALKSIIENLLLWHLMMHCVIVSVFPLEKQFMNEHLPSMFMNTMKINVLLASYSKSVNNHNLIMFLLHFWLLYMVSKFFFSTLSLLYPTSMHLRFTFTQGCQLFWSKYKKGIYKLLHSIYAFQYFAMYGPTIMSLWWICSYYDD
jgi:hypothetical protein